MIGFNNKKIGFIVDSSSNITNGKFDDVYVVPLGITIVKNNIPKSYKDGVDFSFNDLSNELKNNSEIKTSQANMADMCKACEEMCRKYDYVIVLPIHEKLSSNLNAWKIIADNYKNLITVMSYDITVSFEWTISELKEYLSKNECSSESISKYLNTEIVPDRVGFLMVTNLKQLVKGGRVSGIKAALAKLFKINPIILFDKNGLSNFDKASNNEKFFQIVDKYLAKNFPGKQINKIFLAKPIDNDKMANDLVNDFKKHYGGKKYDATNFPTVIVAHTGLDHVAIYFEMK